jgi:hypothetical protein
MSLATIRTQIQTEIGGRTDVDTVIDDQVNFAVEEIAAMYPWLEFNQSATTPTADGQFEYLLPTDLFVLWSVKEETSLNRRLEQKEIFSFDDFDETKTGTPGNWSQWGNSLIIFNAVPDDNDGSNYSLRIRYWKIPTDLSADGDEHLLASRLERGVRLKATAFTMNILNMEEKAQVREKEFSRWVQSLGLPKQESKKQDKSSHANMSRGNRRRL